MATELTKPVYRVTRDSYRCLYMSKSRAIVIGLTPGDVLEFREKGCKTRFTLPIETAFRMAIRNHAAKEAQEKKAKRLLKKRGY